MFNKGDRVEFLKDCYDEQWPYRNKYLGQTGEIIGDSRCSYSHVNDKQWFNVKFSDGDNWDFSEDELKEVQKMELKVGDRFYFPKQTDESYNWAWGKSGVITKAWKEMYDFELDGGKPGSCYQWRLQKEAKGMQKSDLRTGMLVQHKNNEWSVVMLGVEHGYGNKDILMFLNSMQYRPLYNFKDNLEHSFDDNANITKIATVEYIGNIFRTYKSGGSMESVAGFKLLWQHEPEQEVKLKKVICDLQGQLEKAQGELKAIGGGC